MVREPPVRRRLIDEDKIDLVPQERAALVTWRLAQGAALTTMQVAEMTGLARQNAYVLLVKISRVLPLTVIGGCWCMVDSEFAKRWRG